MNAAPPSNAPIAITPEIYDNLVATGFLRTAPDRTFANITNFVPDRLEVIADEIQILGTAVMGLTLHCSRGYLASFTENVTKVLIWCQRSRPNS